MIGTSESGASSPSKSAFSDVLRVLRVDHGVDFDRGPKLDDTALRRLYAAMARSRAVDERLADLVSEGRVPFHLSSAGQEAFTVAAASAFRDGDQLFVGPRHLGVWLWRGLSVTTYLHHVLSTDQDPTRGRQMPGFLTGRNHGVASVGAPNGVAHAGHAVGYAWAARIKHQAAVAGAFFGVGGVDAADFHAAMNFAGVFRLPVVFLCWNTDPAARVADYGDSYGVDVARCDGSDALAVVVAVRRAVDKAAEGRGATLVEVVAPPPDGERADPVERLRRHIMDGKSIWTSDDEAALLAGVQGELDVAAIAGAPSVESGFDDVFARLPWHLAEQRAIRRNDG